MLVEGFQLGDSHGGDIKTRRAARERSVQAGWPIYDGRVYDELKKYRFLTTEQVSSESAKQPNQGIQVV